MGVVGAERREAPVGRQGAEAMVGHVEAKAATERQRAQAVLDRQLHPGAPGLRSQEAVVERGVVGDQDAAVQHIEELGQDIGEPGRPARRSVVRPWMWTGPGSQPALINDVKAGPSGAPYGSSRRAATLSTRHVLG